jgi:ADP-heptose:LPS heptosyltransferase
VEDAAAAMLQMDLIITVDCMAAHLAGALGRPVWMLLRHEADWRWMQDRANSPWYLTMRIFRQPEEGAWEPVVEEVAAALTHAGGVPSSVDAMSC